MRIIKNSEIRKRSKEIQAIKNLWKKEKLCIDYGFVRQAPTSVTYSRL